MMRIVHIPTKAYDEVVKWKEYDGFVTLCGIHADQWLARDSMGLSNHCVNVTGEEELPEEITCDECIFKHLKGEQMSIQIKDTPLDHPDVIMAEAKIQGWAETVEVEEFHKALKDAGIPEALWPSYPSDNKCAERALQDIRTRRDMVRSLPKGRGYSLILENPEELDLEDNVDGQAHRVELTVKVERAEDDTKVSTLNITPDDHPAVPLIRGSFAKWQGKYLCSADLSIWFSQTVVPWCNGVATRSRGGSYYVARGKYLDRMIKVQEALTAISNYDTRSVSVSGTTVDIHYVVHGGHLMLKPEMAEKNAIEVLLDSLINETDKVCDTLEKKLREKKTGKRGLESQRTEAVDMENKLKEYEDMLGVGLEDLKARLTDVQSGIGMAELQIQAKKEEEENQD